MRHTAEGKVIILSKYVDDIILKGDCADGIQETKAYLASKFEIKDLGNIKYFFEMEMTRSEHGISVNQRKYTLDLLAETKLLGCKPTDTPTEKTTRKEYRKEGVPMDK